MDQIDGLLQKDMDVLSVFDVIDDVWELDRKPETPPDHQTSNTRPTLSDEPVG